MRCGQSSRNRFVWLFFSGNQLQTALQLGLLLLETYVSQVGRLVYLLLLETYVSQDGRLVHRDYLRMHVLTSARNWTLFVLLRLPAGSKVSTCFRR